MKAKIYHLSKNGGLEAAQQKPNLPIYSRVYSFGGGMSDSLYAVVSEPDKNGTQKLTKMGKNYEDQYFGPFQTIDQYSRPISKKFGIGFYWDDIEPDFRFSEEEVNEAMKNNLKFVSAQEAKRKEVEAANKKEIEELPKLFPHLVVNYSDDQKITKKNLIAELKKNFPEIKFSVRKDHGSTYYVRWTDGPAVDTVKEITSKFEDHSMDYNGDYRDYTPSNFNKVFGGFDYVFENRDFTEETENIFLEWAKTRYKENDTYNSHNENHLADQFLRAVNVYEKFEIIRTEKTSGLNAPEEFWQTKDLTEKKENVSVKVEKTQNIEFFDYSEKSFAIIGETKPIKDNLLKLGGKYNPKLKCGPGWIFPKSIESKVKKALVF